MTIEEVARKVLREEHGDVIRESVRAVARELMEAEVSELIDARHGERTEDRATHRNGERHARADPSTMWASTSFSITLDAHGRHGPPLRVPILRGRRRPVAPR
jgi:hypothetical protein